MQSRKSGGMLSSAIRVLPVVGLITMLLALAFLQLRWSTKVSEAERERLQQNLEHATVGFQAAFARDLLEICQTLQASQPRAPDVLVDHLFNRYLVWRQVTRHAALVEGLYLLPQSSGQANRLMRVDPQTRKLEPTPWPDRLRAFRGSLGPAYPSQNGPKEWRWDERAAALIHPLYVPGPKGDVERPRYFGTLFVLFQPVNLEQVHLPELGRRFFPLASGFVFQLISHSSGGSDRVAYQSDGRSDRMFPHPDATIPLLDAAMVYRAGGVPMSMENSSGSSMNRVVLSPVDVSRWQIAIRHRTGSVDAAVARLRRRDLAVSIVVLAMLFISLITILIATRRARRLAQLQMEFASGISHELRTPLTVIHSAAENLADGVVSDGDRVRNYGALIRKESHQLSGMVDRILDFAHLHAGDPGYRMESVPVADVVEQVLAGEGPAITAEGMALEVKFADDLPPLVTDAQVLGQCLQNLLSNARKYGHPGRRILLTAVATREAGQPRVAIGVEDFGMGIALGELHQIYEPFYRTAQARESQIHGTGLGLSLTRKMIEALGGQITVESTPGKGSKFTLHVPASDESDAGEAAC